MYKKDQLFAPVLIFAYSRKNHLENLVNSLLLNPEITNTRVYIFCDGSKNEKDYKAVCDVSIFCDSIMEKSIFPHLELIKREKNLGLAKSIITGVTQVLNEYNKVIVIEDDVIVHETFLQFMNNNLDRFENESDIWSIGGYNIVRDAHNVVNNDIYFNQRSSSYCWATWKDRWNSIDWDIKSYYSFRYNCNDRKRFNSWGNDRSLMLDKQMLGKINSWAVRFDFNMWFYDKLNVLPTQTRAITKGHDGSGTHECKSRENNPFIFGFDQKIYSYSTFNQKVEVNKIIQKKYRKVFKVKVYKLIYNFIINNIIGGKNV